VNGISLCPIHCRRFQLTQNQRSQMRRGLYSEPHASITDILRTLYFGLSWGVDAITWWENVTSGSRWDNQCLCNLSEIKKIFNCIPFTKCLQLPVLAVPLLRNKLMFSSRIGMRMRTSDKVTSWWAFRISMVVLKLVVLAKLLFLFRSKRLGVKNENSQQFSVTSFVAHKHNILVKPADNKVLIKISVWKAYINAVLPTFYV